MKRRKRKGKKGRRREGRDRGREEGGGRKEGEWGGKEGREKSTIQCSEKDMHFLSKNTSVTEIPLMFLAN